MSRFLSHLFQVVLVLCFLSPVPAQSQQPGVIGLLTLPEVFGSHACDRFEPEPVALYSAPHSLEEVGTIQVSEYWTFHDVGGCGGLSVTVRHAGSGAETKLPTAEYTYESPAAMVLERQDPWFRIHLDEGSAWVRASERASYHALEELLLEGLTFLTMSWDGRMAPTPRSTLVEWERDPPVDRDAPRESAVDVVRAVRIGEQIWLKVAVLSHSICESNEKPDVVGRGWIPAHNQDDQLTIWFYSRGC
jgi:hypothetical protein